MGMRHLVRCRIALVATLPKFAGKEGHDHGGVVDEDGDEIFAAGPDCWGGGSGRFEDEDDAENCGCHDEDTGAEEEEETYFAGD